MKEVAILIVVMLATYFILGGQRDDFREACAKAGGEALFGTHQEFCVKKGSVIEMDE